MKPLDKVKKMIIPYLGKNGKVELSNKNMKIVNKQCKYLMGNLQGEGGYGKVYKIKYKGKDVVVKLSIHDISNICPIEIKTFPYKDLKQKNIFYIVNCDPVLTDALTNIFLSKLPYFPKVYNLFFCNNKLGMIREEVSDKNKTDMFDYIELIENKPYFEQKFKRLLLKIMKALHNAQEKYYFRHNDLKVDNILIKRGQPTIIDFGFSNFMLKFENHQYVSFCGTRKEYFSPSVGSLYCSHWETSKDIGKKSKYSVQDILMLATSIIDTYESNNKYNKKVIKLMKEIQKAGGKNKYFTITKNKRIKYIIRPSPETIKKQIKTIEKIINNFN